MISLRGPNVYVRILEVGACHGVADLVVWRLSIDALSRHVHLWRLEFDIRRVDLHVRLANFVTNRWSVDFSIPTVGA